MILKGKQVTLRPIEEEDLDFMREMINDPEICRTIVGWSFPISKKDQEQWYIHFSNSDKCVRYIIETENEGRVGFTGLRNIDWKNGSAEGGGIRISSKVRSKGLATDTYITMLKYAFEELRLHRINSSAFEDNYASLKFMEKIGYKREGLQRECIYRAGSYRNVVLMGLLKNDFEERLKELGY